MTFSASSTDISAESFGKSSRAKSRTGLWNCSERSGAGMPFERATDIGREESAAVGPLRGAPRSTRLRSQTPQREAPRRSSTSVVAHRRGASNQALRSAPLGLDQRLDLLRDLKV